MWEQVLGKWFADVMAHRDLIFADAPFPTKDILDPPCNKGFQLDKVHHCSSDFCQRCGYEFLISPFPQGLFTLCHLLCINFFPRPN
jgi:hypothetical protein